MGAEGTVAEDKEIHEGKHDDDDADGPDAPNSPTADNHGSSDGDRASCEDNNGGTDKRCGKASFAGYGQKDSIVSKDSIDGGDVDVTGISMGAGADPNSDLNDSFDSDCGNYGGNYGGNSGGNMVISATCPLISALLTWVS